MKNERIFISLSIFRHVYNYCTNANTQPAASRATSKPVGKTTAANRAGAGHDGANIVGGELYNNLKDHLKHYLEKICEVKTKSFHFVQFYFLQIFVS